MYKRIYTIGYDSHNHIPPRNGKKGIPILRFRGMWIREKAGLEVGDKIQVLAQEGKIAILKINKEGEGNGSQPG